MGLKHSRRVNEAVRQAIAEGLEHDVADPRVRFVVVTGVEVSDDLRHATVYYTSVEPDALRRDPRRSGGEAVPSPEDVAAGLDSAAPRVQATVSRRVRMRNTPALTFRPDPVVSTSRRIDELLRQVRANEFGGTTGRSGRSGRSGERE